MAAAQGPALVPPEQLVRSQSVLLPQTQFFGHHAGYEPMLDQMVVPNDLAGESRGGPIEQFGQQAAVEQEARNHSNVLNFFDESAQELSSIEHSAAAVDAFGFAAGPNPYEAAKRQWQKTQSM